MGNVFSILNEGSFDLDNVRFSRSIGSNKLGNHSEGSSGVHRLALTEEGMLTSSKSIQVASVFITNSIIAEFLISALKSRSTGVLSCHVTGVESKGRCH